MGVASTLRSEVEGSSNLLGIGHTDEGVVQVMMDLVVLVVTQDQLDHGHDLSKLVGVVQGGDILDLVRRDRGVDGIGGGDLHDSGNSVPLDRGSPNHRTGGVNTGSQTDSRDDTLVVNDAEAVILHITTENGSLGDVVVRAGRITGSDIDASSHRTIILAVRRNEILVSGQPNFDFTIGLSLFTSLGVDIASLEIHGSLDGRDVGVNVEIISLVGTDLAQNISGLTLRQSQLNLDVRRGGLDGIVELVLLLVDIDFLTIRSDEEAILIIHLIFTIRLYPLFMDATP